MPYFGSLPALVILLLPQSWAHQCSNYRLPGQAEVEAASNTSTSNPAGCISGTEFFPQRINHSSSDTSDKNTFLQQYEVYDKSFIPGGPIFYWQNPEFPYACINRTSGPAWVDKLGGMVISLEERYYGLSVPYGLNGSEISTWTNEDFRALTLDDSLMDAVTFTEWIRCNYPGAKDSKVIVYGGMGYTSGI